MVIPPASWTIVMASGVVSLDLKAEQQPAVSAVLLWFAAAVWLFLAVACRARWLVTAAIVFLLLALVLYIFTAARFDLRQLTSGRGDHWIAGGALAISALTAGRITQAATALGLLTTQHQTLVNGSLVLWCLSVAWLPVLAFFEAVRPRLSYDVRRWATVFPLGMYAACSFTVGQVAGVGGIISFARVQTWVALGATLVVLSGLVRHRWPAWRRPGKPSAGARGWLTLNDRKGQRHGC